MSASGLVLAAEAAVRVASLNLCTDEHLLLLGRTAEIVSVSHLAHSPHETALWRPARRFAANDGSLESVIRHRPTLILTMGGGGRARKALAERFGIRLLDLPYPRSPAEVVTQAGQVAAALGRPDAAARWRQELARLEAARPPLEPGAFVGGGGVSLAPGGLGAGWLALAGFAQPRLPGGRLSLEQLATSPPRWLIRSDYRAGQESRGAAWLRHPLVARLGSRTLVTDGRPWTCGGLPMLAEVARLKALRGR